MERWIHGFKIMTDIIFKHPETPAERLVLLTIPLFICIIILGKTGSLLGISKTGGGRSFVVSLVGLIMIILAMTAVNLYVPDPTVIYQVFAAIMVSLILVVPLMCFIQNARYGVALVTWIISLGAVAGSIFMINVAFDSIGSGVKNVDKSRIHRGEMQKLYKDFK